MKQVNVMIKPASSLCNMRCRYCFYADVSQQRTVNSFGVMSLDTLDLILSHIFSDLEAGDVLTLAFQGGEPTLAGLDYFRHMVQRAEPHRNQGVQIHYALQTNGFLLDAEWCAFLKEHHFLVGLSLDGPAEFHNANRVDSAGKGTFQRIINGKRAMDQVGIDYNILIVLTSQMARHADKVWGFLQKEKLRYVQFIPCLGALSGEADPYALTPTQYAAFYCRLFDRWFDSYQKGVYVSVKLFDDLIYLLTYGQCNACGLLGFCQPQIIVEADGSVYPCDFYVLDQFRLGSLTNSSLQTLYESPKMLEFIRRPSEEKGLCQTCPYQGICNGGCHRMRHEVFYTQDMRQCGHQLFLAHTIDRLQRIAQTFRRANG